MATVKLLETSSSAEPVVLKLLNEETRDLLERLRNILDRFKDQNDVLSTRISKWGADALVFIAKCDDISLEETKKIVSKVVLELNYADPDLCSELTTPYIEMLQDWLVVIKRGPSKPLALMSGTGWINGPSCVPNVKSSAKINSWSSTVPSVSKISKVPLPH